MGRMHSKGKGMSASAIPYRRGKASWCKSESQDVCDKICIASQSSVFFTTQALELSATCVGSSFGLDVQQ